MIKRVVVVEMFVLVILSDVLIFGFCFRDIRNGLVMLLKMFIKNIL